MMWAFCLSCPSASLALQNNGLVPRESLDADITLHWKISRRSVYLKSWSDSLIRIRGGGSEDNNDATIKYSVEL